MILWSEMLHLSFVQDSKQFYLHLTAICEERRVFTPVVLVLLETGGAGGAGGGGGAGALGAELPSSVSGVSVFTSSTSGASELMLISASVLLRSDGCSLLLFLFSKFSNMCMMASTFLSSRDYNTRVNWSKHGELCTQTRQEQIWEAAQREQLPNSNDKSQTEDREKQLLSVICIFQYGKFPRITTYSCVCSASRRTWLCS